MTRADLSHLTRTNLDELNLKLRFRAERLLDPEKFFPFLRPCRNRVLVVADGLDFSEENFGLSTFVRTLLDSGGIHVRHVVTLAHINNVAAGQMMDGDNRIAQRITSFRFDNPAHFDAGMYDIVMLFGIATAFGPRGTSADGTPYPADRLADTELRALTQHMNSGGGLFATGDHGSLGRALGHAVPRARGMRLWQSTSIDPQLDEVSMGGPRRNDTNRPGGSLGSQFNDQSDDVPQEIQPRWYTSRLGLLRWRWPHPLLCGPNGVIRVMPDHPHEGECVEPAHVDQVLNFGGNLGPEYPPAADGGTRPLPQVISHSTVLSGTTSGGKAATVGHRFGGIAAYDGHRADVGRVITDATWHHFVNINLTGIVAWDSGEPFDPVKDVGFLASAQGQQHLADIRAYYRNLVLWATRPERLACINTRMLWFALWSERILEAVLSTTQVRLEELDAPTLRLIGGHARDVLGRYAGRCESIQLVFDLVLRPALPELVPHIDPWHPIDPERPEPGTPPVAWLQVDPLLDVSLGAALVALHQRLPEPSPGEEIDTDRLLGVIRDGGAFGAKLAVTSLRELMQGLGPQIG